MAGSDGSIDTDGLGSYLSAELDVSVVGTEVLHDGLNLSLAVDTAEAGRAYVLRRPNELRHTEPFNDLRREYELLERLRETPIEVPESVLLCEDESIAGDPFLLMTHLDGVPIRLGSRLPERYRNADARRRVATCLIDTLADIHSLDVEPFTDVCDREPPSDQIARTTERLDAATRATGREFPALRDVAEWLERNAPQDPDTTLVHGDFRPSNVLFGGTHRPRITGVLDWETTFLGDPLTELGYLLLRWRDDGDPTPSLDGIESRYRNDAVIADLRQTNRDGLAPFTNEPGSPSRRELIDRYEDATGLAFENEQFYGALAAFLLATVWADLHRHRIETGGDSDWGPHIDYMTAIATSIVDGRLRL